MHVPCLTFEFEPLQESKAEWEASIEAVKQEKKARKQRYAEQLLRQAETDKQRKAEVGLEYVRNRVCLSVCCRSVCSVYGILCALNEEILGAGHVVRWCLLLGT